MFSNMESTLTIAFILSAIVFIAAVAAEGRGQHLLRIMLGLEGDRGKEQLFADVDRQDNNLRLVTDMSRLEEFSRDTTEIEVSAAIDAELKRGKGNAAA
ncbi:hypothetical protein [Demequina oxidasica]|uniref:hypothetical protein n=1 Tax=Demequina oxidasica TaxID=676199 RepID=UPI000782A51A|nr:hypothetical protein [Demequina oxidasica]